jgi:hypothetical protein
MRSANQAEQERHSQGQDLDERVQLEMGATGETDYRAVLNRILEQDARDDRL